MILAASMITCRRPKSIDTGWVRECRMIVISPLHEKEVIVSHTVYESASVLQFI